MAQQGRRKITDQELLQAGWELLQEELAWGAGHERPGGVPERLTTAMSLIGPTDVANRVNATTGAFYSRWPNQGAFARALATFILEKERHDTEYLRAVLDAYDNAVDSGKSLPSVIRITVEKDLDITASSAAFAAQMYFWSLSRSEPSLQDLLRTQYVSIDREWHGRFEKVMNSLRLELRPGIGMADVCTMFSALAEGMAIRRVVDPDSASAEVLVTAIMALVLAVVDWEGSEATVSDDLTTSYKAAVDRLISDT